MSRKPLKMHDDTEVVLYCPDCRGQIKIPDEDFQEGEVLECYLCAAEILVVQQVPARIKLFTEEDDF